MGISVSTMVEANKAGGEYLFEYIDLTILLIYFLSRTSYY